MTFVIGFVFATVIIVPLVLALSMLYFCSADGHYELKLNTKAIVHHNGLVAWQPPATYKSACDIDVEYFPLDIQTCFLKLGSWTYAGYQVRITNINQTPSYIHCPHFHPLLPSVVVTSDLPKRFPTSPFGFRSIFFPTFVSLCCPGCF